VAGPPMFDVNEAIQSFFRQVESGSIEIYNECSLQYELGIFLRSAAGDGPQKVQFERPVGFFGLSRPGFVKKEIDLVLFSPDQADRIAIELKFPRNGQVPEQMFSFCQDIAFVEQLVASGFRAGFFVAAVDDPLFYRGRADGIYSYFRGGAPLQGRIMKPTGRRDETVDVCGQYTVEWRDAGPLRYACIQVMPAGAASNRDVRLT
jgi:hypothetical protein